eukprot:1456359-Prymnesium_polylepis.1
MAAATAGDLLCRSAAARGASDPSGASGVRSEAHSGSSMIRTIASLVMCREHTSQPADRFRENSEV